MGNEFRVIPIPLKTVRPFVFEEVVLSEHLTLNQNDENECKSLVVDFLIRKVHIFLFL
jgi:hypothetical protein